MASASYDDQIRLYQDDPSDDWFSYATLTGHTSTVWSISFSPCGDYLASASDDETVRIWRRLNEVEAGERGLKVDGKMPGRPGEKWICVQVLKGWWQRTVYHVDWTDDGGEQRGGTSGSRSLGRLAAGGGDGRICVFQANKPAATSDGGVDGGGDTVAGATSSLAPEIHLIATITDAHGVADINSLAFGPGDEAAKSGLSMDQFPDAPGGGAGAGAGGARIQELSGDDDDDEGHQTTSKSKVQSWTHLLASTGDDGTIKVWRVP